jgi:hypothetical protein
LRLAATATALITSAYETLPKNKLVAVYSFTIDREQCAPVGHAQLEAVPDCLRSTAATSAAQLAMRTGDIKTTTKKKDKQKTNKNEKECK